MRTACVILTTDRWHTTDDRPFGGGAGMVMKPEPLARAIDSLRRPDSTVIYLTPDGEPFSTPLAQEFARIPHLLMVSGHYEGIDERIRETRIDREVSIGDYVLTNGNPRRCGADRCHFEAGSRSFG